MIKLPHANTSPSARALMFATVLFATANSYGQSATIEVEARMNLRKLCDSATSYFVSQDSDGVQHQEFPRSTTPSPSKACSSRPACRCTPDASDWRATTWQQLNFSLLDPHYFQYEFSSSGRGRNAKFTARAIGDPSCSGQTVVFERSGWVENGNVVYSDVKRTSRGGASPSASGTLSLERYGGKTTWEKVDGRTVYEIPEVRRDLIGMIGAARWTELMSLQGSGAPSVLILDLPVGKLLITDQHEPHNAPHRAVVILGMSGRPVGACFQKDEYSKIITEWIGAGWTKTTLTEDGSASCGDDTLAIMARFRKAEATGTRKQSR